MGIVGVGIAMLIGVSLFSSIDEAVVCTDFDSADIVAECEKSKQTGWIVISILPIALFFVLFQVFGGLEGGNPFDFFLQKIHRKPPQSDAKRILPKGFENDPYQSISENSEPNFMQKILLFIGLANIKNKTK